MSGYVKGRDRNQISIGFMCLDNLIDENNKVRAIDAIVDSMNKTKLSYEHSETKATGRPPHDPIKLLKLYIYSYYEKIRSSRKIEKECTRNIEVMWLIEGIVPDHKCISDFRKNNKSAIKAAFSEFVGICDMLGLLDKNLTAIDGSKFRASNARKKHLTIKKANKKIEHFLKMIDEYNKELDENDSLSDEVAEKIENAENKVNELENAVKSMKEKGINEISETDPDCKLMGLANMGYELSYNVQNAVDGKYDIIVETDVVNTPADQGQLYKMAVKTAETLGVTKNEPMTILADKGYFEVEDIQKCEDDARFTAIVAKPDDRGNEGFKKSDFKYDEKTDCYTCPAGQILHRTGKKAQTYTNGKACKTCEFRNLCTTDKRGRKISRNESEKAIEAVVKRFSENKELYKRRQMIVEHSFGTVKRTLGFTYFLTRGLGNVRTENRLHMLTYNIKRVLNIYSVPDLVSALNALAKKKQVISFIFRTYFDVFWLFMPNCVVFH